MDLHEVFLRAIAESLDDDAPRLVYADWLEESGDPTGARERRTEETRRRTGIPYSATEVAALQQEAAKAGVAPLAVSEIPLGS